MRFKASLQLMTMNMQRREIRFTGRVQGVGFRFTALRVAAGYDLVGYVRNMPDGSVECVVEGQVDQIDEFMAELADTMAGYIRQRTEQTAPYSGNLGPFTLKY